MQINSAESQQRILKVLLKVDSSNILQALL